LGHGGSLYLAINIGKGWPTSLSLTPISYIM